MRRIVGYVLLGLGVFAVALGLLLKLYAYPRLAKAPLDPKGVSIATGSDITALVIIKQSDGSLLPAIHTGLDLTASRFVTGDLTQPEVREDGEVASWIEAVQTVDQNGNLVKATQRQVCLDRHTNEAVEPCNVRYVQSTTSQTSFQPVKDDNEPQPGVNLKFPFGTEQRGYQVYDLTIRDTFEATFDGQETIDGLETYRFVQEIPPTKIEDRTVPGNLIGSDQASVDVDLYYQNRRVMWVEPVTGQIVKGQEIQHQELVEPSQTPGQGTVVLDGTLTFDDETVSKNIADAKENKSKLWLLTTLPVILWIGGAVLVVGGLVLLFLWRSGRGGVQESPSPPEQRELTGATR